MMLNEYNIDIDKVVSELELIRHKMEMGEDEDCIDRMEKLLERIYDTIDEQMLIVMPPDPKLN